MPYQGRPMEQATAFDKLVLLLVGKEKSGKSRVAATARKPVLFLDTDNRSQSIAGQAGVYAISFTEKPLPNQPAVYNEVLENISKLESSLDLSSIIPGAPQGTTCKTLVFDSCQTLSKAALAYAMYTNKALRREINFPTGQVHIPSGWDAWAADMNSVESALLRALAIPGLDVIMTIHEEMEEAPDSTSEKKRLTGKIDVFPGRHRRLIKYFNEVWRITRDQQLPQAQLVPNFEFTAATNLSNAEGVILNPNISALIEKHLSAGSRKV